MPIKYFWAVLLVMSITPLTYTFFQPTFTLMLDPAGDAQYPGRIIEDSFERGITLQCVEELQTIISKRFPSVRVVITRLPGETRQPLQHANFANRLDVDLFISIHCYPESKPKSQLYLYYYSCNDTFIAQPSPYGLYPYDKAHLLSLKTTKSWGATMEQILRSPEYSNLFMVRGLYTIPFAPLIGIKKPAIALEIGLKHKDSWKQFIEPIVASITPLLERRIS
jgi:N-acetylmuramoyl-L-alanine amidase